MASKNSPWREKKYQEWLPDGEYIFNSQSKMLMADSFVSSKQPIFA
jgi:hypothetical protein